MSNRYSFNITLAPYGDKPEAGRVAIDTAAGYGYWEHRDGSEGGGLWFSHEAGQPMELQDYDGDYELPRQVIAALRAFGFTVGHEYD